jgi:tetratricopeptide (TPR) repeat protein
MKSLLRPLTMLAVLCLGAITNADSVRLEDGTHIPGYATKYDEATEVLSWKGEDGKDYELKLADLNTRSTYSVLKSQVPKDNGKGQLQLANFTRDIELFVHAVRHYGYAEKADPSLKPEIDKEVEVLKSRAAKWGMAQAREAAAKGDKKKALDWLERIILKLPDQPEAAEAQRLIDDYYASVKAEHTKEVDSHDDEVLKSGLAEGKKAYDSMLERNKKALQSKGGSTAIKGWEAAVKDGQKALDEIDKFEAKHKDKYAELLNGYRTTINEQIIEIHLNCASQYATRSSYNKALTETNKALAIDSKNAEALSMRARIQDASSRGLRWL